MMSCSYPGDPIQAAELTVLVGLELGLPYILTCCWGSELPAALFIASVFH